MSAPGRTVVIVLHYRGVADTLACLASLFQRPDPDTGVLVVDNGSGEPVLDAAAARFPAAHRLRLAQNFGWAGGNNRAIAWARARGAEAVCLLNNDTLLPPGAIAALAEAARRCGPCLMHPAIDFADPAEGTQLDPTRDPAARPVPGTEGVWRLAQPYGACLLVPMAVFDRIGLFDERFFLQLEETDFGERAGRAGIPALCLPAVRILHTESASFGGRATVAKSYYIARNQMLLAAKRPPRLARFYRAARSLYWWAAMVVAPGKVGSRLGMARWLLSRDPHARAMRRGLGDFLRRRFGPAPGDLGGG